MMNPPINWDQISVIQADVRIASACQSPHQQGPATWHTPRYRQRKQIYAANESESFATNVRFGSKAAPAVQKVRSGFSLKTNIRSEDSDRSNAPCAASSSPIARAAALPQRLRR